jgi:hypothetical protein
MEDGTRPYPTNTLPDLAPAHPGPSRVHAVDAVVVRFTTGLVLHAPGFEHTPGRRVNEDEDGPPRNDPRSVARGVHAPQAVIVNARSRKHDGCGVGWVATHGSVRMQRAGTQTRAL